MKIQSHVPWRSRQQPDYDSGEDDADDSKPISDERVQTENIDIIIPSDESDDEEDRQVAPGNNNDDTAGESTEDGDEDNNDSDIEDVSSGGENDDNIDVQTVTIVEDTGSESDDTRGAQAAADGSQAGEELPDGA